MDTLPELSLNKKLSLQQSSSSVVVKLVEVLEDREFVYLLTTWMQHGDLQSRMCSRVKADYLTEGEMRAPLQ